MLARFHAARTGSGEVVLEGFHACKHALRFGAEITALVTSDAGALDGLAAALAPDLGGRLRALAEEVEPALLADLVPRAPATGVVALARRPAVDVAGVLAGPAGPIVLLEDPRRLGNVGAVVRVAAAAGAAAVLTTGPLDPWAPDALRGSAGLHFVALVARVAPARRARTRADGEAAARSDEPVRDQPATRVGEAAGWGSRPLIALDPGGDRFEPARLPARAVLAFGTERHGLSPALLAAAEARVALPMRPGVSSLNLATAVAAVLYALGR